ncbi:MAG: Omp28-related outer membrane protein [Bacteroidales bacterium]|nr:Omp28-related outer membrane protein [Bacteroidales bacterium]
MKKTLSLLAVTFLAAGLCMYSCTKEEKESSSTTPTNQDPEQDPNQDPVADTLVVNVSRTPSTRNVLIEELTGNHCGYCPLGHKAANEVVAAHPGKAFVINYHVPGGLADAYTTTAGAVYNSIFNVDNTGHYSIPAGTINRHDFNTGNGKLTLDRGNYAQAANQILTMNACANVAAAASINRSTRELKVKVQVYFTADGTANTYKLYAALIQNNVLGYQSGASGNPDQVVGSQYRHNEMFQKFISHFRYSAVSHTYSAGDDISDVTEGSLFEKEYTYTIPESFRDTENNNSVTAVLEDLEVIVFVAEGEREVINVCKAPIVIK